MPASTWQEGDIAFLKDWKQYNSHDCNELVGSGYIHPGATNHPCIILKKLPEGRVVITTVSAYGSGVHNHHAAPWLEKRCYARDERLFRSFEGSQCGRNGLKPLQLIPGQTMPKPKTSWLNIRNVYNVPLAVIGRFTNPHNRVLLKMAPASLANLRLDIASRSPNYDSSWAFVDTISSTKRGSTGTTKRQPRALPEAPMVTSCQRPTANTTTSMTSIPTQRCHGSAQLLRSQPTTTPASSTQSAPSTLRSWADIVSKTVASKPAASAAPLRTTPVAKRTATPWVKALA